VVVAAACDGACSGNPGPGGWGSLLRFSDGSVQEFGGFEPNTTNNRMELTAALTLLEQLAVLPRDPNLTIRTDSKYLIDGFSKWINGWKRKGWRTASGSPVLNRDLWEALDAARVSGLPFTYVKGHSGDPDNDRCDAIAVAYSKGQKPQLAHGDYGGLMVSQSAPAAEPDLAPPALQQLSPVCRWVSKPIPIPYGITADGRQFRPICQPSFLPCRSPAVSALSHGVRPTPYA
jgi:ribonuclease HI